MYDAKVVQNTRLQYAYTVGTEAQVENVFFSVLIRNMFTSLNKLADVFEGCVTIHQRLDSLNESTIREIFMVKPNEIFPFYLSPSGTPPPVTCVPQSPQITPHPHPPTATQQPGGKKRS